MDKLEDCKKTVREIRIDDNRINEVAIRASENMGIPIDKAETELKIGVMIGIIMNRHKVQELKETE